MMHSQTISMAAPKARASRRSAWLVWPPLLVTIPLDLAALVLLSISLTPERREGDIWLVMINLAPWVIASALKHVLSVLLTVAGLVLAITGTVLAINRSVAFLTGVLLTVASVALTIWAIANYITAMHRLS